MIIYRPVRGGLDEAMAEKRTFENIHEMFATIEKESKESGIFEIEKEWLLIDTEVVNDTRIGWKDTRKVLTVRIGNQDYLVPQCIGYMATEFPGSEEKGETEISDAKMDLWRQLACQTGIGLEKYLEACVDKAGKYVNENAYYFRYRK